MVLEARPKKRVESQATSQLRKRVSNAMNVEDDRERLRLLSDILNEVDEKMDDLEGERAELVQIRNQAMETAADIANRFDEPSKRRVLFHILDEHDREVERFQRHQTFESLRSKRF